jgi:hypothetical protein
MGGGRLVEREHIVVNDALVDPALLAELRSVVNPPEYAGAVRGSWDERSLVYSTGGGPGRDCGMQALVTVCI